MNEIVVFLNKHAIVIGPTPPGTGVIADKFKIDIWLPLKQAKPEARRIAKELGITTKKTMA